MINKNSFINIFVILSFFINSCSVLPVSDETKDVLNKMKEHIFQENRFHLQEADIINDKKISDYLYKTLNPILKLYHMKGISIFVADSFEAQGQITVSTDEIYISKGMLYAIKNEAELVSLIGHEVGHAKLHHLSKKQPSSNIPEVIKDVIESTTGTSVPEDVEDEVEDIYLSQFNQKKEQEADEFGAITAAKLGYNAYSFADLFDRLNSMSDQSVAIKLRNLLKGSHKTLGNRAEHIRSFLKSNNIPESGKVLEKNYLKHISHLAPNLKTTNALKAQKNLTSLYQSIKARSHKNTHLTVDEFLSYTKKIRSIAKNLGLLSQLKLEIQNPDSDNFMMESVKVLEPWWAPQNTNLQMLNNILASLSRMGIGTIPFVGDAIDLAEVLTGEDFLTGKPLTFGERVASAIGFIVGSGKAWRSTSTELGALKSKIIDEKEVSKVRKAATETLEKSPILGMTEAKQVKEIQKQYRLIKNEENYKILKKLAKILESKNIPDDWKVKVTKPNKTSHQGLEFIHPDKDIRIRVMPGNPNSKFPNSRKPYVRQIAYGHYIDINGNKIGKSIEEGHISLEQWKFKEF